MEDKETELGRPLNEEEGAAILKKHGHPMFVAARYRQTRQLIGSTLFPVYWFTVKMILGFVGFGYDIAAVVVMGEGKLILEALGAIFSYLGAVLPTFAWVTIVFAVLDIANNKTRLLEKINRDANEKFDPRKLPALKPAVESAEGKPIPRYKTAIELFLSIAFLLWWIRVSPIRRLALFMAVGPIGLTYKIPFVFGPTCEIVHSPLNFQLLLLIVRQTTMLILPDWI